MLTNSGSLNTNKPAEAATSIGGYSKFIKEHRNIFTTTLDAQTIRTPLVAMKAALSRIIVISSRTLGEMLDCHDETYTFLRATGAVEHRAGDGVLLAISINGKHYMDRPINPVPVRPGAVGTSRRRGEALARTIRHKGGTKKMLLRRRAPMSIQATKPDQRICGDGRSVTLE